MRHILQGDLKRALRLSACLFALSCGAQGALAEESSDSEIGEIIVTAQKRAQNVQDAPATINVLSADDVANRQIRSLDDLQTQVAGLKFDPIAGNSNVTIRGVGTTFTTGAGENSVSLHLDGVYISSPQAASLGQFDLGGIEVLRGPQGTLYGKNSTSGIVNFLSAAPTEQFEAGLRAGYGNYNEQKAAGYVSGPLAENVNARLYVEGGRHDGYVENLQTGQKLADQRYFGARLGIDADPTDSWNVKARVTYRREGSNGPWLQPFNPDFLLLPVQNTVTAPRKLNSPLNYDGNRKLWFGSLTNSFDLGEVTLVSITGASKLNVNYNSFDTLAQGNPLDPFFPNASLLINYQVQVKTLSQEFNVKGNSGNLDWLAGVFYYDESGKNTAGLTLPASLGGPLIRAQRNRSKRQSASAFADITVNMSENTKMFGGVRGLYERARNDLTVHYELPDGTFLFNDCVAGSPPQKVTDWSATGRLGVQHDFSEDVMAYSQVSRGYKSGGFSVGTCRNQFKPETVNAVEAGLKTRLLDRKATLNFSAFYYDYSNIAVEQSTLTGTDVVNAPKSELYGVEIDSRIAITPNWTLDGNATFMHSEYRNFLSSGGAVFGDPDGTSLAGRALNKAPGASGTIGTELKFPVGTGNLTLRGEGYFTSSYRLREYNSSVLKQKGYSIFNAFITYEPNDRLAFRAFARNISKTNYIQGTVVALGGVNGVFNPPRTFGAEMEVKFR